MELWVIVVLLAAAAAAAGFVLRSRGKPSGTGSATSAGSSNASPSSSAASKASSATSAAAAQSAGKSAGAAERLPIKIFYGSQSGTAETYAQELGQEASRHGFSSDVVDLDDYDPEQLREEPFAVFLVATFGEGDPTDNAVAFQDWLLEQDADACNLDQVTFAVFALGNRQYEHYCAVGRRFDKKLHQLGGVRLLPLGEGDDDGSLEDDYNAWKERFWTKVHETFQTKTNAAEAAQAAAAAEYQPAWEVEWLGEEALPVPQAAGDGEDEDDGDDEDALENHGVELVAQASAILHKHPAEVATLVVNKELRKDARDGSTRLFALDISKCSFGYRTADNLEVMPKNNPRLVRRLAERLGLNPESKFTYRVSEATAAAEAGGRKASSAGAGESPEHRLQKKMGLPLRLTIRNALDWFLDFTAVPRSKGLLALAHYAEDPEERRRLEWLANDAAGRQEMQTTQRNLLRLLMEFKSVKLPWNAFLDICPRLQPRMYTISSSNLVNPKTVELTVVLSTERLSWGVYEGVCSNYLARLHHGHQVCVAVRPSTFQLPEDRSRPVIMVGPGTGIAPFRAFIQEYTYLLQEAQRKQEQQPARPEVKSDDDSSPVGRPSEAIPPLVLYFGCRYKARDFIFEEELVKAHEEDVLEAVHVAFSRDTDKRVYVTDLIPKHAKQLWKYIREDHGHVYVCGAAAMGRGVQRAFAKVFETAGGLETGAAEAYLAELQNNHRYIQELWS